MVVVDNERYGTNGYAEISLENALDTVLSGYSEGGTIEAMQADIDKIRSVLVRFMALQVRSVDDLNYLNGYKRFSEVDE